jgi:hypothetical protein
VTRKGASSWFVAFAAVMLVADPPLHAQGLAGRVALEGIASVSSHAQAMDDPMVTLDLVGTVRIAGGWDIVVRPWSMRRPGGDWMFEMYQLQVRYVSSTRVPFRLDAGVLPSPVGLFTLELQPHRNPLISAPSYYFAPLPAVDGKFTGARLVSGGYPLGAVFSVSGARWDTRAGITDSSPALPRNVFSGSRPPVEPQLVFGGGISPVTGMRLGIGITRGRFRPRTTAPGPIAEPRNATVFNLEGEYAVGHTRLAGEWLRDRFETVSGTAIARGFTLQAAQTLSPRIFAAARATRVSSPVITVPAEARRSSTAFEASLGYRLTTELTLRGGYQRERGYQDARWKNAAVMSVVWAERWW